MEGILKNIRQFELIIEIVRSGSISKAAEKLHISQPTLSKYIMKYEKDLGLELFNRATLPIKLTSAGRKILNAGEKILDIYHQLDKEISEIKNYKSNEIRVGISPSRTPYFLPDILKEFQSKYKNCKIIIKEENTNNLRDDLLRGDLDLMISLLSDETRAFTMVELMEESILLACPKKLIKQEPLNIIINENFINIGVGLRLWKITKDILDEFGGKEAIIECQSIESAITLVNNGFGSMFVPSYFANNKYENIIFKQLPSNINKRLHSEMQRKVGIFYRKEQFLTNAEKTFIEVCMNKYFPEFH